MPASCRFPRPPTLPHPPASCLFTPPPSPPARFLPFHPPFPPAARFLPSPPLQAIPVGGPISHVAYHAGSGLAALAVDGVGLRVYDAEAGRLVRRFPGHR